MMRPRPGQALALLAAIALAQALGCNDTPITNDYGYYGDCRYDPYGCGVGDLGGACNGNGDCDTGYCCRSRECGNGMCTYPCDNWGDCPGDMGCEHHVCFFTCYNNGDCAPGQKCDHGRTVCEWD